MSLTSENMESRAGVLSHTIYRDIPRMDDSQLERYMRMVFTGERDLAFLPEPFWDGYWFEFGTHGRSSDGRVPNSPAVFLAGMHDTLGAVARGTFTIGAPGEEQPDFSYRPSFRRTLDGILDECASIPDTPTPKQVSLAGYAVEAVGAIQSIETFNFPYLHQRALSSEQRRVDQRELAAIPSSYPDHLRQDLQALRAEGPVLLAKAKRLIASGRFGELKLEY
ncbi:MAG TPA: hypothetical protein VJG66_03345 [Patescibacteria group bacterium]|nr:hypothetical protein [Patescibacteria group bacterium]